MLSIIQKYVSRSLGPFGFITVGLVTGLLAEPVVRKGMRRLAVKTTAGVLAVTDRIHVAVRDAGDRLQGAGEEVKEGPAKAVSEVGEKNRAVVKEAAEEQPKGLSGLATTERTAKEDIAAVDGKVAPVKARSRSIRKKVAGKVEPAQ